MDNIDFETFINTNEKTLDNIVIQLGSHSIKIGYSSQNQPFIIPNCIAYKIKNNLTKDCKLKNNNNLNKQLFNDELIQIEKNLLNEIINLEKLHLAKNKTVRVNQYKQKKPFDINNYEQTIPEKKLPVENNIKSASYFKKAYLISKDINEDLNDNNFKWSNLNKEESQNKLDYLVGRDALCVSEEEEYEIRYPIQYGYFNTEYSVGTVINDLEKIIAYCLYDVLKLNKGINFNKNKYSNKQNMNIDDEEKSNAESITTTNNYIDKNSAKQSFTNNNNNNNYNSKSNINDFSNVFAAPFVSDCNLILIIPDIFVKYQLKKLVNLFFKKFLFKNIIIQQESVMTSFASAISYGCIVDIGSSKTNICCVEDGNIIKDTIYRNNYGGNDVSLILYKMMELYSKDNTANNININQDRLNNNLDENKLLKNTSNKLFPTDVLDYNNYYHRRIIEKLKEEELEFPNIDIPIAQFRQKFNKVWIHKKNNKTKIYNILFENEAIIPNMIYFNPTLIKKALLNYKTIYSETTDKDINYIDPEDVYEELITNIICEKKEENKISNISNSNNKKDNNINNYLTENSNKYTDNDNNKLNFTNDKKLVNEHSSKSDLNYKLKQSKNLDKAMFDFIPLDKLIAKSIMSIENSELRMKVSNCIIFTGGASKTPFFTSYLEEKLLISLNKIDPLIDRVEIVNLPSFDGKTLTWIGGSIIPKLETSKELCINRNKWIYDNNVINNKTKEAEFVEDTDKIIKDIINKNKNNNNTENKINNYQEKVSKDEVDNINNEVDLKLKEENNASININYNNNNNNNNNNEKAKSNKKRKDKIVDIGIGLLRQKIPFAWSYNYTNYLN